MIVVVMATALSGCSSDVVDPDPTPNAVEPSPTPDAVEPSPTPDRVESNLTPDAVLIDGSGFEGLPAAPSTSVSDVETYFERTFDVRPQTDQCSLAIAEDLGVAFVFDTGTAVLATIVDNSQVRTAEGIGVGSSTDEVLATYGDLAVLPGYASHTGGELIIIDDPENPGAEPTASSRLLAFDTDTDTDGTVTRIRAGGWPWVGYLDYCSDDAGDLVRGRMTWPLTR